MSITTACHCCGSEVKRLQEFLTDYKTDAGVLVCPNCFSECLSGAKHLRKFVGIIAFKLAKSGFDLEELTADEICFRIIHGDQIPDGQE